MTMTLVASGVTGTFCFFGTKGQDGGKGGREGETVDSSTGFLVVEN